MASKNRWRVSTREIPDPGDLLSWLPTPRGALSWVLGGDGLVGCGTAARFTARGADRFSQAQRWWSQLAAAARVHDEVRLPGTGLVAFISLAFADEPGDSVVLVPKVLVGRSNGVAWMTTVDDGCPSPREPVTAPQGLRYWTGAVDDATHRASVAAAVARIRAGELDKVVLARDLMAIADAPLDERYLLTRLAEAYPTCWVYAVNGLVGATPELLLRRHGATVSARLLAGTVWPRTGTTTGAELSREILASTKNHSEHQFGVRSLTDTLTPFCTSLDVPAEPSVVQLANVAHLATDVRGTLTADTPLLELAAHVHPTAATGGTPTAVAVRLIAELEHMDRRGYLGPIGWLDAAGNGELGVALRCGQVDGSTARLYAGGGIVADSDPATEAAEAAAKFRVMQHALASTL